MIEIYKGMYCLPQAGGGILPFLAEIGGIGGAWCAWSWKMVAICCNAHNSLLLTGERELAGDGRRKITVRLRDVTIMCSVKDATSINNDVRYQVSVSAMRSVDVAHAHKR